jgi:hypothetical protein
MLITEVATMCCCYSEKLTPALRSERFGFYD